MENGYVEWIKDRNGNTLNLEYGDYRDSFVSVTDAINKVYDLGIGGISTKGVNGQNRNITINRDFLQNLLRPNSNYSIQRYIDLFPEVYNVSWDNHNPYLISSVQLPNGQSYHFYYNPYGELARVELPTGGAIEYDYGDGQPPYSGYGNGTTGASTWGGSYEAQIYRRVYEERVYPNGGTGNTYETKITYSLKGSDGAITVDARDNNDVLLSRVKHYYYGDAAMSLFEGAGNPSGFSNWLEGREYKTETFDYTGTNVLIRTEQSWDAESIVSWWSNFVTSHAPYCSSWQTHAPRINPHVTSVTTTLTDVNLQTKKTFTYDSFNNVTDTYEYDYKIQDSLIFSNGGRIPSMSPTRITHLIPAHICARLPLKTWVSSDNNGRRKPL